MPLTKTRFRKGIQIAPDADALEGIEGEIKIDSADNKIKATLGAAAHEVVTNDQSQTLSNKTLTSPVINTGVSGTAIDTDPTLAADSDTLLASQKAVRAYVDSVAANQNEASEIAVTPAGTIAATDVQAALEELDQDIQDHLNDTVDAHNASAISSIPSGNLAATEVQAALNELQSDIDTRATASSLSDHLNDTVDAHDASAISNVPSGNLAATDIQGAVDELQSDIDTRALNSDLTTHTSASTGVHGVVGSVVGTSDSQTLTNKIITGADIRTPIRSDVKQDTKANLVTYAITASNGQLAFATDTKEMFQVVDGLLESVGGGAGIGGVDILFSQTFEEAAITDFTQTGLSLSTSNPLHGEISALMTHDAGSPQSFKQVIAVDEKFRGQSMILSLNTKSTASAGNVTISVYDETNAAAILSSTQLEISSATGGVRDSVTFTIPATCLSMSYTITALQEAGSPVTRVDDILCQINYSSLLETSVTVPVITNQSSTASGALNAGTQFSGAYTTSGAGIYSASSGIITVLKEAIFNISFSATNASTTTVVPAIEINNVIMAQDNSPQVASNKASSSYTAKLVAGTTISFQNDSPGNASSTSISITATAYESSDVAIPLTQSGLVQEADSQLKAVGNGGTAVTSLVTNVPFNYNSGLGSALSWNGSQLTVVKSGVYSIKTSVVFTTSASRLAALYVDGVFYAYLGSTLTSTAHEGNLVDYFTAGKVLSIRASGGGTLLNDVSHFLTVTNQGSLKQVNINTNSKITIPTSELRFEGASARGTGGEASTIQWTTLAKIRGDAFSVSNTNGTLITMTKAGRISVSASAASSVSTSLFAVFKNSEVKATTQAFTGTATVSVSPSFDVAVDDIVKVTMSNTPTSSSNNTLDIVFQEQSIQVSVSNTLPQFSESDMIVRCAGNGGQAITAGTTLIPFVTQFDSTGGAWNGTQFTVSESGILDISGYIYFTASAGRGVDLYVDGVLYKRVGTLVTDFVHKFSITESFSSGQVLSFRVTTTGGTLQNSNIYHYLNITKVGKPNVTGVNVTPFVNVPQPVSQSSYLTNTTSFSNANISGALTSNTNNGLYSYDSSTGIYTALKNIDISIAGSVRSATATAVVCAIYINEVVQAVSVSEAVGNRFASCSAAGRVLSGQTFRVANTVVATTNLQYITVLATATSSSILTAPETFSTDTAALTYAGSGTYTLATLANAPVGTFITFTYAGTGNTRTQTTVAPTQTTADMNANGILMYPRAYNANSTAALPSVVAIQIGKGLKGKTIDLFKASGKVNAGNPDYVWAGNAQSGMMIKDYNETTGVLVLDCGYNWSALSTVARFTFSDATDQTSGYVVVNASKNPALTGLGLGTVAARGVNTAGTSIGNGSAATLVYDAVKSYDTHGALNTATGVFTAPESGYYQANWTVTFADSAYAVGNQLYTILQKNSTNYAYGNLTEIELATLQPLGYTGSTGLFLAKGDTVNLTVGNSRTAGATLLSTVAGGTHFSIHKTSVGTGN